MNFRLVVREAIEVAKLPPSVRATGEINGEAIQICRQKIPGVVWHDRYLYADFAKWPIVRVKRSSGTWTKLDDFAFKTVVVNVAAPSGVHDLGRAIGVLLGV